MGQADRMPVAQRCRYGRQFPLLILLLASLMLASTADAKKRKRRNIATFSADWASAPSVAYGRLSGHQCKRALRKLGVRFTAIPQARGVRTPIRIADGVGGVLYRTLLPPEKRAKNPHDVFDCRLVRALYAFSKILRTHSIDEVLIYSSWRPPSKRWPKGRFATRHPGALAVDVFRFGKNIPKGDKERASRRIWLDVKQDFNGKIGILPCGSSPPKPSTPEAVELRAILCKAAKARIFTSMLTPNYDQPHHNHFHLELRPKVKWRIVR